MNQSRGSLKVWNICCDTVPPTPQNIAPNVTRMMPFVVLFMIALLKLHITSIIEIEYMKFNVIKDIKKILLLSMIIHIINW